MLDSHRRLNSLYSSSSFVARKAVRNIHPQNMMMYLERYVGDGVFSQYVHAYNVHYGCVTLIYHKPSDTIHT